jgi:hypothetical protein
LSFYGEVSNPSFQTTRSTRRMPGAHIAASLASSPARLI